ncbi:unnamed protein product, partial [Iphiclides podalirius]
MRIIHSTVRDNFPPMVEIICRKLGSFVNSGVESTLDFRNVLVPFSMVRRHVGSNSSNYISIDAFSLIGLRMIARIIENMRNPILSQELSEFTRSELSTVVCI